MTRLGASDLAWLDSASEESEALSWLDSALGTSDPALSLSGSERRIAEATAELEARADPEFSPERQISIDRLTPEAASLAIQQSDIDELFDPQFQLSQLSILNQHRAQYGLDPLEELPPPESFGEFVDNAEFKDLLPYVGDFYDMLDQIDVLGAAGRVEDGTASPDDIETVADYMVAMAKASRGGTFGRNVAAGASELLPFMAEFATGGLAAKGISKLGQKGLQTAIRKSLNLVAREVARMAVTGGVRVASETVERMTPTIGTALKDGEVYLKVKTPGENLGKALSVAAIRNAIEVYTEKGGELIGLLSGPGVSKAGRTTVDKVLSAVGFQGVLPEMGEELAADVLRESFTRLGVSDQGFPLSERTVQSTAEQAVIFMIPGTARFIGNAAMRRVAALRPSASKQEFAEAAGIPQDDVPTDVGGAVQAAKQERAKQDGKVVEGPEVGERIAETEAEAEPAERSSPQGVLDESAQAIESTQPAVQAPGVVEAVAPAPSRKVSGGEKIDPPYPKVPVEPTARGESHITSIKNAVVDEERVRRGLRPAMQAAQQAFGTVWDEAMAIIEQNPARVDSLIVEMLKKPRPHTPVEAAMLLHRQIDLQNQYDHATTEYAQAGDEISRASAETTLDILSAELLKVYDAGKAAGTEAGRALNIRKMLADEQFSLVKMTSEWRRAGGGKELTEDDFKHVRAEQALIKQLESELADMTRRAEEAESKTRVDAVIQEAKKSTPKRISPKSKKAKENLDAALKDFEAKISGTLFSNPLDPELIKSAVNLAKAYIGVNVTRLEDFLDAVRKRIGSEQFARFGDTLTRGWDEALADSKPDVPRGGIEDMAGLSRFAQRLAKYYVSIGIDTRDGVVDAVWPDLKALMPEITRGEVEDAISGYGQFRPLSKDAIDVKLRDIKGQLQQIGKLRDMESGQAPKRTGVEQREASDEERRLRQQVEQMKKRGGFVVTDPAKQLRSALDSIKTRLKNQIADLEHQIQTRTKIVREKIDVPRDAETKELERRRDDLRKQFDEIFSPPGLTDEKRIEIAEKAVERSIANWERRIKTEDFEKQPKKKGPVSWRLAWRRAYRDALKKEFAALKALRDPRMTPEARNLAMLEKRLAHRLAEYQRKIADGDFERAKPRKTVWPPELKQKRLEVEKVKREWLDGVERRRRANRHVIQKIDEALRYEIPNTVKALRGSLDFPLMRQGVLFTFSHPVRAIKALGKTFKAVASEDGFRDVMAEIEDRPNAELYHSFRLQLTGIEGRLTAMEEVFMSHWARNVPLVAASERAYVGMMNIIRADWFDQLAAVHARDGQLTNDEGKLLANAVNVFTGRGDLGAVQKYAAGLSTVFWAPRLAWSRFQVLTFQPLRKGLVDMKSARTRALLAKEYARMIAGAAMTFGIIAAGLYALLGAPSPDEDDDTWWIEPDWRSSDFGKIRIGRTRYDILGGLSQSAVLLGRWYSGETKTLGGDIVELSGEGFRSETRATVGERFLRGKLSPVFSVAVNILDEENMVGEPTTPITLTRDLVVPLPIQQIKSYVTEYGFDAGLIGAILTTIGTGVDVYEDN